MLMSNDLRCAACDYTEIDAIYERHDGTPVCPDCGAERTVDWSTGRMPAISGHGYGSFVPINMGVLGKCETREQFDHAKAQIEARFPGHRVELESETAGQKQTRLDALRHRSWERKKVRGFNAKMLKEVTDAKKRVASEAPTTSTQNLATKSPAQLLGGE